MRENFGPSERLNAMVIPDLAEVRLPNDGGGRNIVGTEYQFHFAAGQCLDMLTNPGIEFVASELQDDVVVKRKDGSYTFYQVKGRTGSLWTISSLQEEGVWTNFLRCCREFGQGHTYVFVSDQDAKVRSGTKKPDLGRMRQITTENGRGACNEAELVEADDLIQLLKEKLDITDRKEAEALFWNMRIWTKYDGSEGLEALNLQKLERGLTQRGIASDLPNQKRIYDDITTLLRKGVAAPPFGSTLTERLEHRKVSRENVETCISGPFRSPTSGHFDLDADPEDRSLRQKCEEAGLPNDLTRFFVESRNRFYVRFRMDRVHALGYLENLRWKVWGRCVAGRSAASSIGNYTPGKAYREIRSDLERLASEENAQCPPPPIEVDLDYLHGMMCQLTAECNNEWQAIG
jgi:hypothetical protein